jgi:hypothetical protein
LPAVKLVDVNNNAFNVAEESDKETVIFFWTSCARAHLEKVYKRVEELKAVHPNVNFIAINVDKDAEWKKVMAKNPFLHGEQLRAVDYHELKDKWVFTVISRTIILNPDVTIKNAFTNLSDAKFEENL